MKTLLKLLVGSGLMLSSVSYADFLIEPYLGYHTGKIEQGTADDDIKGMVFGGRFGFSRLGFQAGLDYMGGTWETSDSPTTEYTLGNLGVFAAYSFPILIRGYASYFFDANMKDDNGKLEGTAIRLGVGFSPLPLLDINLEYMMATFGEYDGNDLTNDVKTNTYGIVFSIPFDL